MRIYLRLTAYFQLVIQVIFLFVNSFIFSFPAHAATNPDTNQKKPTTEITAQSTAKKEEDEAGKNLAAILSSTGSMLSQDNKTDALINSAINNGSAYVTGQIQQWLQQFGTAKVNLGLDKDLSLNNASLDLLLPLYDDKKQNLLFTQWGGRRDDDRNIINVGMGYRYFADRWMWGINTFYDRQISDNAHERLGIGGELGWNYFKLSANGYKRLSGWKDSSEYEDYQERVANGYDIRAEGYLPAWPQLGAQLVWEQYYGDDVALFDDSEDDRQRNPYAVTAGVNYTPFPLVSIGLNQKMGKGNHNDTQIDLAVNWMLGSSLKSQLDSDAVKARRTLLGSRLDLINRNNNIVLEYRKQDLISLKVQNKVTGTESETLPVSVNVKSKYPLDHISWEDDNLVKNGGKISENNGSWSVTLPHYQQNSGEKNLYVVSATAWDNQGNKSNASHMTVEVSGFDLHQITSATTTTSATLPADGVSTTQVTVTVTSGNGEKITGLANDLSAQLMRSNSSKGLAADTIQEKISAFKEQSPGVYVSTFTSGTLAGVVTVQPYYNQTSKLSSTTITLTPVSDTARFATLSASKTAALANARDVITLTAHVVDAANNSLQGVAVHWATVNPKAVLSASTSNTDAQGNATVSLTSSEIMSTTVSAQLDNGQKLDSETLQFTADSSSATVTGVEVDKKVARADGQDTITVQATVMDAEQHPLANQPVDWAIRSAASSTHLSDKQSNTNENGVATITLTSAKAGQGIVTASTGNSEPVESETLTFMPDVKSATLSAITADKTAAQANGADAVTLSVKVEDANHNPIPGAQISWTTTSATAILSASDTSTDAKGNASISVTSTTVENVSVVATMKEQAQTSPDLQFTVDNATAAVESLNADKTQAVANQNDFITLTARVVDANDHPVPDSPLKWQIVEGQATLSATQTTTDQQGSGSITLTSSTQGNVVVSVSATAGDAVNSPALLFIADTATAKVSDITVDKSQGVANGNDHITYTAIVTDASGNPVKDQEVTWNATPATANLSSATSTTDSNGNTSVTITTLKAGSVNVTAQAGASPAWNAPTTTFVGDKATAQILDLKTNKSTALANGTDSITFTGTVIDANNNVLEGVNVAWAVTPTTGVLSTTTSASGSDGKASVSLTSSQVESYQVTATVNGKDETSGNVSFTADSASASLTSLTSDETSNLIAGNGSATLTAVVQDATGHPIAGAVVNWSSDNTTGNFSETTSTTNSEGKAIVTFSGTHAQLTTITASSVNNSQKTVQVTIAPDTQSAQPVTVVADKHGAIANGADTVTLTATIQDQYGNFINQGDVAWTISPEASYHLSANNQPTNNEGQSIVTLASDDVVSCKGTATFNGLSKSTATIRFTADTTTEKVDTLNASKTENVVAGKDTITLEATVTDENGHPVADTTVHWGTDNSSGTFQPGDSSVTDSNGVATVTYSATKAVPTLIGAGINQSEKTITVNYIGNADTAKLSNIKPDKTKAVADNTELVTWSVDVKDANGNILPGISVNWSSDDPDLTLAASSSVTNEHGVATITGRTLKARDAVVKATLSAGGQMLSAAKVTFIGDAKTAMLMSLNVDKFNVLANGGDAATYTAYVEDINHNIVPDATVSWRTTMNKLSSGTSKTNSSGKATVKLSGNGVGMVTVTATINNSSMSKSGVKFINVIEDTWYVKSGSSTYTSSAIKGYPDLGFVVASPTTGPTYLEWSPTGTSKVTTPVTLIDDAGQQYTVNLKGNRTSDCSTRPLNAAVGCSSSAEYKAQFTWNINDNKSIPPGHYTGLIHFYGKDWHTAWAFEYRLTMDLTIN